MQIAYAFWPKSDRAKSDRVVATRARLAVARRWCNRISRELRDCIDGWAMGNFVLAGRLVRLSIRELDPHKLKTANVVDDDSGAKRKKLYVPEAAVPAVELLAQLVVNFHVKGAGDDYRYRGVYASNAEMARMLGCSPDHWSRWARPWLESRELLMGIATTGSGLARGRRGERFSWGEAKNAIRARGARCGSCWASASAGF